MSFIILTTITQAEVHYYLIWHANEKSRQLDPRRNMFNVLFPTSHTEISRTFGFGIMLYTIIIMFYSTLYADAYWNPQERARVELRRQEIRQKCFSGHNLCNSSNDN